MAAAGKIEHIAEMVIKGDGGLKMNRDAGVRGFIAKRGHLRDRPE
jgi:hypothetical protein